MKLECSQCHRGFDVPDDAPLKSAACPHCAAVVMVPPRESRGYFGAALFPATTASKPTGTTTNAGPAEQRLADAETALRHNALGSAYASRGLYDRALMEFNLALMHDPTLVRAYNNRGYAYSAKKDFDLALADFNSALKLDPK